MADNLQCPKSPQPRGKRGFISKKEANRLKGCFIKNNITAENPTHLGIPDGRRVIHIKTLADALWCKGCDTTLSLKNVVNEKLTGLASILKVRCTTCEAVYEVPTENVHPTRRNSSGSLGGRPTFDVNYKAALGMLDAGIGPRQLNTFFSALNIPTVHENLLKRHERKVGPIIETVAIESCIKMIELEKSLTETTRTSESETVPPEEPIAIAYSPHSIAMELPPSQMQSPLLVQTPSRSGKHLPKRKCGPLHDETVDKKTRLTTSYDMGWQCRGNGKTYDSKSGHGTLIGHKSKKILSYATRIKLCRKCASRKQVSKMPKHDCRANFNKSSKAMEADVAVSLVTANPLLEAAKVEVGVLIGDEDSSTIANVRLIQPDVEKWSDVNHIKKSLNNSLYSLQKKHRVLQTKVIKYLKRCFSYAIAQNKGNARKLTVALNNIPAHVFGKHEQCQEWCTHKTNPDIKYKALPRGQCLSGHELLTDLKHVFSRFADNARKIAPCGSTQGNESVNAIIASKAPKSKHYSGSESLDFRVACAVSQSNLGTEYIVPVNKKMLMSPGTHTQKYRTVLDCKRHKDKVRKQLISFKKRRLQLALKQSSNAYTQEHHEGTVYQSDMGLLPDNNDQVTVIPLESIDQTASDDTQYVYFDLETSGVSGFSQVIQIAAVSGKEQYNVYILPITVSKKVTEITGLMKMRNVLLLYGKSVKTISRKDAWSGLMNFLCSLRKRVVLVGHNIGFDLRFLIKETKECGLQDHANVIIHGIIDTLKVCKEALPNQNCYKQEAIASYLKVTIGNAHNAINDVLTLQAISNFLPLDLLHKHTVIFKVYCDKKVQTDHNKANRASLLALKDAGLSAQMIGRIANAGLNLEQIKSAYAAGAEEGVQLLLCGNIGKPAVTSNKKAINIIVMYIKSIFDNKCMPQT